MIQTATADPTNLLAGASGVDFALAAASILFAWILSIFARRGVLAVLRRLNGITEGAAILTARIVRYTIILLGVGVAFAFLGASIQPLVAIALIVVAVVFLALRGVSNNFAAGIILQTRHPLKVGDEIQSGDYVGTVKELNGRSVVLLTRDGRTVHVPNSDLLESALVNHSTLGRRRSDIFLRCRAGLDRIDEISSIAVDAAHSVEGVRRRESVQTLVTLVDAERVFMTVRFWHHPLAAPAITSPVIQAISAALAGAGIESVVTTAEHEPPLVPPSAL